MTCETLDERLDDWVDGVLPAGEAREVEAHLASCRLCRERERRQRQVLAHAAALPRSVSPPRDLWPAIAREIDRGRAWTWDRPRWWSPAALAAAAVVLIALGAMLLRQGAPSAAHTVAIPDGRTSLAPVASASATHRDPGIAAAERDYEAAASALLGALQSGKAGVEPATLASIERNLAVIDQALAEVRQALDRDPANPDLNRMLVATHRKKVDVLRRVVKLSTAS
jgi:hypothetical protein